MPGDSDDIILENPVCDMSCLDNSLISCNQDESCHAISVDYQAKISHESFRHFSHKIHTFLPQIHYLMGLESHILQQHPRLHNQHHSLCKSDSTDQVRPLHRPKSDFTQHDQVRTSQTQVRLHRLKSDFNKSDSHRLQVIQQLLFFQNRFVTVV